MERDIRKRTTRRIVVLLELSALLLVFFGGGAVWFVATRGSDTPALTMAVVSDGAASVRLAWGGSPNPKVVGYKILYGTESRQYTNSLDAGNETTATVGNLSKGKTYYMVAVALDAMGNQSPPSNEITVTTPR